MSTTSANPAGTLGGILRALRYRNYRLFFSGQLISLIGTWMQTVAQSWLVYRLTGSAALLGLVGFSSQIPVFFLAPLGGAAADRWPKRRILLATQSCAMLLASILATLTLTEQIQVWHIFVLAALLGTVNAFDIPARQAFVVEMVGKTDLMNAIALNSSMFNGARIVGPALAGVLVAAIGEGWCFFANAVSYIAVILGLVLMRGLLAPPARTHASALAAIVEGFRYVGATQAIRMLLLLLGAISLLGMPYAVLMPVFAARVLGGGARELGWLMGASGVGALIGALSMAWRRELRGLGAWIFRAGVGFGVALLGFSASRSMALSLALLVCAGLCMMVLMAGCNTLIQMMVPDALRGRVMALYSMMFMGMAPIGALLAGVLAAHIEAPLTVALCGAASVLAALLFGWHLPRLRASARELLRGAADASAALANGGMRGANGG